MNAIKVLIAEANAAYRHSLCQMLQAEEGIEVLEPAVNGHEAIEKSKWFQSDIVLMDIDMPEKGGLLATRIIRERWPQIKVIILSLHSGEASRAWAKEIGATAFLPKDADLEEIVQAIRMAGDTTRGATHLCIVQRPQMAKKLEIKRPRRFLKPPGSCHSS